MAASVLLHIYASETNRRSRGDALQDAGFYVIENAGGDAAIVGRKSGLFSDAIVPAPGAGSGNLLSQRRRATDIVRPSVHGLHGNWPVVV